MELSTISKTRAPRPSVEIRQAYKRYASDTVVLKGFNMTVPKGKIYALLGSSGCGKTTVLNCIVGQCTLDSGSIRLSADRRCNIGFMPQNLCLYQQLSIYENACIFGYLSGMTKERVLARTDELIDLLELPSGDRNLETLSGGQQRRVSMAIAFLHRPSIVILDEPTVGVDVNLTQVIWDYFLRQTNSEQTIIITTHYIQEAHRAHRIGMLRNGVLIAEENPRSLMEKYENDSLESIFLNLSEKQQAKKIRYLTRKESHFPTEKGPLKKPYFVDDNKKFSAQRMKSVLYKNVVQMSKSYAFLLTILVGPIIQVFNFHVGYGGLPEELKIGFVNDEISIRDCNYTSYTDCFLRNENFRLSCMYMDLFRNRTYELKEYGDEASAVRAVKKNEIWAAFHFEGNYTQSITQILATNDKEKAAMIWENLKINTWLDLSSNFVGTFVKQEMLEFLKVHYRMALEQCNMSSKLTNYPGGISFQPPFNVPDGNSAAMSLIIPSLLVMLSVCLASTSVTMIGTEEKLAGTILRMQAGGLSLYEFLLSVFIIQIILLFIRTFTMFALVYWILGYDQKGDLMSLMLLLIIVGLMGVQFGLVCSVMTTSPTVTMIMQSGFLYFVAFSSGILWPFEGQQRFLHLLNYILPFTWAVSAAQRISLRELSFTNDIVLSGIGIIFAWIIIFAFIIGYILKYRPSALVGN